MPSTHEPSEPHDFRPLPFLGNPHIQTLLGHFLSGPAWSQPVRRCVVQLPDGDALMLYDSTTPNWAAGGPIALIVHGLTGSHASPQVMRLARMLLPQGWRVVRLDMRGAGPSIGLARHPHHAGRSDDLRAALAEIHRWSPTSPLALVGFSLGGNVVLKLAGEAAEQPVPGLQRIGALAPPIDLERCSTLMSLPSNRLYDSFFVRGLLDEARRRQRYFSDTLPRFPRRLTILQFDDLYTAPRSGFAGALDYYRRASSYALVSRIQLPACILTARDDPFVAVAPFEELRLPPNVTLHIVPRGGHLGFVGWDGAGGFRWAERRMAEWLVAGPAKD